MRINCSMLTITADHHDIRLKQTKLPVRSSAARSRIISAKETSTASGSGSVASGVAVGLTETIMTTAAEVLGGHVPRHRDIEVHHDVMISGKFREGSTRTFQMEVESAAHPGAKARNQRRPILCLLLDAIEEVVVVQLLQGDVMIPIRQHLLVQDPGKAILAEAENVVIVETDPTHLLIALAHHRLDHAVGGARLPYHRAACRPSRQEPGLELADSDRLLRDLVPAH